MPAANFVRYARVGRFLYDHHSDDFFPYDLTNMEPNVRKYQKSVVQLNETVFGHLLDAGGMQAELDANMSRVPKDIHDTLLFKFREQCYAQSSSGKKRNVISCEHHRYHDERCVTIILAPEKVMPRDRPEYQPLIDYEIKKANYEVLSDERCKAAWIARKNMERMKCLEAENKDGKDDLAAMEEKYQELQKERDELQEERDELQEQNEEYEEGIEEMAEQNDAVMGKVVEQCEQMVMIKERFEKEVFRTRQQLVDSEKKHNKAKKHKQTALKTVRKMKKGAERSKKLIRKFALHNKRNEGKFSRMMAYKKEESLKNKKTILEKDLTISCLKVDNSELLKEKLNYFKHSFNRFHVNMALERNQLDKAANARAGRVLSSEEHQQRIAKLRKDRHDKLYGKCQVNTSPAEQAVEQRG